MDEKKLKIAFSKIKKDMDFLKEELNLIKKGKTAKKELDLKFEKLENTIKNVELKTEGGFEKTSSIERDFNLHKSDYENFVKKALETRNRVANEEVDINLITRKQEEIFEKIEEKIENQINNLRVEIESEIAKLSIEFTKLKIDEEEIDKKTSNTFDAMSEIVDEKINVELNSLRLELTNEIASIYDKFYDKINEVKKTNIEKKPEKIKKKENKNNSENKTESLYESEFIENQEDKKESKIKKMAKWLFVDEEDDEEQIKNIKKEIDKK